MADLHLSDGEWKLMKVLWQQSPRTLGALVAALAPTTGWSKATVFMMLKRLIAKGAVSLDESGKYQQYSAAVAYAGGDGVVPHEGLRRERRADGLQSRRPRRTV